MNTDSHPYAQRELPAYNPAVFCERRHRYALVIPVINEGYRLKQQLSNISLLNVPADVVIADGGSTDDSVEHAFLKSVAVRACLTKVGVGRLSAQLRMAYAWCLDQDYEGIITIDGNGKDGVEAIGAFIEKLKEGFDYVQGSRYRPGGKAVNTPLERHLAGRFIHAPILSAAGRRWYTDTTNGFRAYSRRYLLDPRVQPFRAVFDRYALLFYLTARAGQLGYKTIEVPVTRTYPAEGKIPTKISGMSARVDMLRELLAVAVGQYNP